jgi:hypothetical protein
MDAVTDEQRLTLTSAARGGALQRKAQGDLVDSQAAYAEMTQGGDPRVIVINVEGAGLPPVPTESPPPQDESPTMDVGTYIAMDAIATCFGMPGLSPRPRPQARPQAMPQAGYYGGYTPPPSTCATDRFGRPWQDETYTPRRKKRRPRWLLLLILLAITTVAAVIPMTFCLLGR